MITKANEAAYEKKYNIEWYLGNGRLTTTSAVLKNVGDGYFYFEYSGGGLFIVEQRAIRSLECIEQKQTFKR